MLGWQPGEMAELAKPGLMGMPNELNGMEDGLELRIKGQLAEIEEVDKQVIENGQGRPPALNGYRKTLESVAECAGPEIVDDVAEEIKNQIKRDGSRPANLKIRQYASKRVSEEGESSPDDYLLRV